MTTTSYVIAAGHSAVGQLVAQAQALDGQIVALVVGTRAVAQKVAQSGVHAVVWLGEPQTRPAEAFASAVAERIAAQPGHIFATRSATDRVLLGAAAAAVAAPVITGATKISESDRATVVDTTICGGIACRRLRFDGPVAVVMDAAPLIVHDAVEIEYVEPALSSVEVVSVECADCESVDLSRARRIVAVGGGLKRREDLFLVEELAKALGAELGCTRPIAEGLGWLPRDRYIGISGSHVSPDLYVAVGVSGQLQHMAGCRTAKTVVAINTDPGAPIMGQSDYSIPGDLYELVPALTTALRSWSGR